VEVVYRAVPLSCTPNIRISVAPGRLHLPRGWLRCWGSQALEVWWPRMVEGLGAP